MTHARKKGNQGRQGSREGGRREGGREGRKEGGKEGGREGRKEGRPAGQPRARMELSEVQLPRMHMALGSIISIKNSSHLNENEYVPKYFTAKLQKSKVKKLP
jgi:hypothetical protein